MTTQVPKKQRAAPALGPQTDSQPNRSHLPENQTPATALDAERAPNPRRRFLISGTAAAAGIAGAARAAAPPGAVEREVPADATKVQGYPLEETSYGLRSQFETEIRTRFKTATPLSSWTLTPLQDSLDIITLEHAGHAGFAAQIDTFVGQHGYDARRWHRGEARRVGHGQQGSTLGLAQGMAGQRTRPAVAYCEACLGLPALKGAHINAGDLTGWLQPCAASVRCLDVLGKRLAIFEADHSSSPLLKIAATFFDSNSSAAVLASARSLRNRSRSKVP